MAAPAPYYCAEQHRLVRLFTRAMSDYLRLEAAQIEAVVSGEQLCARSEIEKARRRLETAKEAILKHVKTHACEPAL